jgi:transcriptional regulator with XRE-family HTH domain
MSQIRKKVGAKRHDPRYAKRFGQVLRSLRLRSRQTQGELAEILGMNYRIIGMWELGRFEPSLGNLCKLADLFGVSLDQLVGRNFLGKANGLDSDESLRPEPRPDRDPPGGDQSSDHGNGARGAETIS